MSKKMKQFVMVMLVIVMSVSILAVPAAADTGDLKASIDVEIQIDPHYIPAEKDTFKIKVTPEDPAFPMPAGGTDGIYEVPVNGDVYSKTLDFTMPGLGVYTYSITQYGCFKGDKINDECYLDKTSYILKIYVLNENPQNPTAGGLVVKAVLQKENGDNETKPEKALFVNRYAKPVEVPFSAKKFYNNRTPKTKLFYFLLKDADGKTLETVYNVGKNVTFTPIVYDEVGTYTYTISERIYRSDAVVYDTTVFTVTVEVTRDIENEGDYEATVTYKKDNKPCKKDDLTFYNRSITDGNPFTGDQFRMVLWVSVMVISLGALLVLVFFWNKSRKK